MHHPFTHSRITHALYTHITHTSHTHHKRTSLTQAATGLQEERAVSKLQFAHIAHSGINSNGALNVVCSDVLVCSGSDRKSYDTFVTVVQHRELLQNNPGSEENKKEGERENILGLTCVVEES
mgnify:CR=1 FL=1